jgi:hypothetical protein
MPLRYNLQIDLFDVWGIDFMGPFQKFAWIWEYPSHGWLCIQVGRGYAMS